jgi:5'-deoxynucleotidase YfbR-like HD superfamily hydrolase
VPLAREFTTLKRVHDAGRPGSWAARAFARAWRALAAGTAPEVVARRELAAAGAAARLGALDAWWLAGEGWDAARITDALARGWAAVGHTLAAELPAAERAAVADTLAEVARDAVAGAGAAADATAAAPAFVARLAAQPRAGPTHPAVPRLVLLPAESHAEHCWAVAAIGALLAPAHGADAGLVFLTGLAHHLPNAWLPDAGWAADVALGDALGELWTELGERALAELPDGPRAAARSALLVPRDVASAEARAFHAADALDRVLEMEWFARAAAFRLDDALDGPARGGFDVLHPGPAQAVEREALAAMGFAAGGAP